MEIRIWIWTSKSEYETMNLNPKILIEKFHFQFQISETIFKDI